MQTPKQSSGNPLRSMYLLYMCVPLVFLDRACGTLCENLLKVEARFGVIKFRTASDGVLLARSKIFARFEEGVNELKFLARL